MKNSIQIKELIKCIVGVVALMIYCLIFFLLPLLVLEFEQNFLYGALGVSIFLSMYITYNFLLEDRFHILQYVGVYFQTTILERMIFPENAQRRIEEYRNFRTDYYVPNFAEKLKALLRVLLKSWICSFLITYSLMYIALFDSSWDSNDKWPSITIFCIAFLIISYFFFVTTFIKLTKPKR